ncbi:hypothetical protein Tco_0644152 [Tanacetum coccineum]
MQTEKQEHLSIEEKSKLFVELLEKRKKHFAALRAKEKRNKPPTKTQKRMRCFENRMKRKTLFVDIDKEIGEETVRPKQKKVLKELEKNSESDNSKEAEKMR